MLQASNGIPKTKETVAFTRYADKVLDPKLEEIYQFPRGAPYTAINPAELFMVQKSKDHNEHLCRSKDFLAADFFSPQEMPRDANLRQIFMDGGDMSSKLCETIPHVNHD